LRRADRRPATTCARTACRVMPNAQGFSKVPKPAKRELPQVDNSGLS
jgi:hypothetical protein